MESVSALLKRGMVWAVLNFVFFGCILVSALLTRVPIPEPTDGLVDFPMAFLFELELPLLAVFIFVFNLAVSAFLVVTLPGLALFALSWIILVVRACFWGVSMSGLRTDLFLAAFPTIVLEGEGYVIAGVAGTILGLSWLRPRWLYEGKVGSRREALRLALGESLRLYVLVTLLLIVAAVVEAITIRQLF